MNEERKEWAKRLIGLYQEQLQYGAEIVELTELFFKTEIEYNEEAQAVLDEEQVPEVLAQLVQELENIEDFVAENIKAAIKATQKATGHKGKKLFMPIRVATTGQTHGPELPDAIEVLGKAVVSARLQRLLNQ